MKNIIKTGSSPTWGDLFLISSVYPGCLEKKTYETNFRFQWRRYRATKAASTPSGFSTWL